MPTNESDGPSTNTGGFRQLIAWARQGKDGAIAELVDHHRNYLLLVAN